MQVDLGKNQPIGVIWMAMDEAVACQVDGVLGFSMSWAFHIRLFPKGIKLVIIGNKAIALLACCPIGG